MGQAEVISLDAVRASKQWASLRQQLHDYFDLWLDDLQGKLPEPETTLAQITETVWALRQELTGSLTEAVVEHGHRFEFMRQDIMCQTCQRLLTARPSVPRTVETMVGSVRLERPYFYCRVCREGSYPLDEALGLTPGSYQLDVQKAAAKLVIETSYDEAKTLFHDLTGVHLGSERMHTLTNRAAEGLSVLDIAPSREQIDERIARAAAGKWRRPVVVLGIDGEASPTTCPLPRLAPRVLEAVGRGRDASGPDAPHGRGSGARSRVFDFISSMVSASCICSVGTRSKMRPSSVRPSSKSKRRA